MGVLMPFDTPSYPLLSTDRVVHGQIEIDAYRSTIQSLMDVIALGQIWLDRGMVAREGIEPPTRGFSVRCSTN